MFEVLNAHSDADKWRRYIDMLPYDLRDVHLTPEWGLLHEDASTLAHLAVLTDEAQGFIVCQPFLHRDMPGERSHSDITAAGYGGPFTSSTMPAPADGVAFDVAFAKWRRHQGVVSEFYLVNPVTYAHQAALLPEPPTFEKQVTILPRVTVVAPNRGQSLWHFRKLSGSCREITLAEAWGLYEPAMERLGASARWRLSREYFERLGAVDHSVIGAFVGDAIVAMAVFIFGTETAYYHLAARAELAPSGAADECIIFGGLGAARQWLHLGGGLKPGDTLEAYKRSFGGIQRPVYSIRRVHDPVAYERLAAGVDKGPAGFFPAYRAESAA